MRRIQAPEPPLARGEVVLRLPSPGDASWIARACAGPGMSRWIPNLPQPYSASDAAAYVRDAEKHWIDSSSAVFAIEDAPNRPVGMIEVHLDTADDQIASVGYFLAEEGRGKGTATTALQLVSEWSFGELGIIRISVTTDPENHASQAVAERAGYVREGLLKAWLRTPGGRRDSVMFSLVASKRP